MEENQAFVYVFSKISKDRVIGVEKDIQRFPFIFQKSADGYADWTHLGKKMVSFSGNGVEKDEHNVFICCQKSEMGDYSRT